MTAHLGDRLSDRDEGWSGVVVQPIVINGAGELESLSVACECGFGAGVILRVDMRGCALEPAEDGWARIAPKAGA
jgi:hypothetical protein